MKTADQPSIKYSDFVLKSENFIFNHAKEAKLIELAKSGDQDAWTELYKMYTPHIYKAALKIIQDQDESKNITHDVWVKCIQALQRFDTSQHFLPWMNTITRNHCINLLKKKSNKQRRLVGSMDDENYWTQEKGNQTHFDRADHSVSTPLEILLAKEEQSVLLSSLEQIPSDFRQIIHMKYFQRKSYSQIAEELDIPEGTVMSRLFNARGKLKEVYSAASNGDRVLRGGQRRKARNPKKTAQYAE